MRKFFFLNLVLAAMFVYVYGCGDKKDDKKTDGNKTATEFVNKDSLTGKDVVLLKYNVKKGDKFYYKLVQKNSSTEKSPATEDKEVTITNEINYYYSKEVDNVDNSGIISYKINFDSINIASRMGEQSRVYNSNINDSNKQDPEVIPYNSIIATPFFIRVSSLGKISELYGMETVYDNIFKALGDTLKEQDKAQLKQSFSETIKELLQKEMVEFPAPQIPLDSGWVRTSDVPMMVFETVASEKYTIKGVEDRNGQKVAVINGALVIEFKNKEIKEKGMTIKIENSDASGQGLIEYNLSRGCIQKKESTVNLKMDMKLSAQGQTANSSQGMSTTFIVNLMN